MDTELTRILRAVQETPWAILPAKLAEIRRFLFSRISGVEISVAEREALLLKAESQQRYQQQGSVAVIPVFGTISQRLNMLSAYSGGTSTEILGKQIREAVADPNISAIILNVDSPGGTVSGLPELHSLIMEARSAKPIVAVVNAMSASAAYWITSAASEISITPSGEAGSIGVYAMHVDESAALEQEGVKVTFVYAAKYKVEANPYEPLTEEAAAAIQADVDKYYSMFVRDVAKGRGVPVADVKANFGEGRMLLAGDAKAAGLADRIESLDQAVSRLSKAARPANSHKAMESRLEMASKFL